MRGWRIVAMGVAVAVAAAGAPVAAQMKVDTPMALKIAAGSPGASFFQIAAGVGELIKETVPGSTVTIVPGGGSGNPQQVSLGKVEAGIGFGWFTHQAMKGDDPYTEKYPNVRSLGTMYDQYMQTWVRANAAARTLPDIVARKFPLRIVVGRKGFAGEAMTRAFLREYGLEYKDVEAWGGKIVYALFPDGVNMIRDGHADALASFASINPPFARDLVAAREMRLMQYGDDVVKRISAKTGLQLHTIPGGTYKGTDVPFLTLKDPTIFLVRPDMADAVAYHITKLLNEHKERLTQALPDYRDFDPKVAPTIDKVVPLHPGARRYYEEKGLLR